MSAAPHFTAVIEVTKVTPEFTEATRYDGALVHPRVVTDVARVVVRATDLDELKARVTTHVELVAE
jgi:hypothetical protein